MSKVLIVEDDPSIRMSIELRLGAAGYQTCTAADGASGFRAAMDEQPDLIVMDVSMPDGNGFEVARRLRAEEQGKDLPILFLTASRRPEFRVEAEAVDAIGFLEKPYDAEVLLGAIREALAA